MKSAFLIIIVLSLFLFPNFSVPVASADTCKNITKLVEYSYNTSPTTFNSNYLQWTASGSSQIWKVERSDDYGANWYTVQQNTSKRYQTGMYDYLGDNVLLRVTPISCSGIANSIVSDPVPGPSLITRFF